MTLDEYDLVMMGWQEVHEKDSDPIDAPDVETVRRNMQRLRAENE